MSLARSSLVVGLAAAASRILGFIRDILVAGVIGAGPVGDAFLIALRLPNLIRGALNEGGLNAGFVPLYAKRRATEGPAAAGRFADEAASGLALLLCLLIGLVEACASAVVLALALGYAGAPATLDLATLFTRLTFPAVAGLVLASLVAARLNAEGRFIAAALAPVAAGLTMVAALAGLSAGEGLPPERAGVWLAGAFAAASLAHLAVVTAAARRLNPPLRYAWPRATPAMRRLFGAALGGFAVTGASQVILLAGMQVASFTPSAVSWLYYAERVFHLPVGLVGAAMGLVVLSAMAERHAAGDRAGLATAQSRALEASLALGLPAACALAILARPIATVLFERGAFTPEDARRHRLDARRPRGRPALRGDGKVLSQAHFARGEIRAALAAGALAVAVALVGAAVLPPWPGARARLGVSLGFAAQAGALARSPGRSGGLSARSAAPGSIRTQFPRRAS
jgi:putative peptidoglycan lipid II flippase